MLPNFNQILVFVQLFAVCLSVMELVPEAISAKPYQTIPARCQVTSELPTEVKYTGVIGYEYSNETGHWYKFYEGPVVNWTEARQVCQNDGANLAVPNSDTEAKIIMGLHARYLNSEITGAERPDWVLVGVFWENGAWKTVDGQFLAESGYSRGTNRDLCNISHEYPYGVMNRGGKLGITGRMLYPFVCEKENCLEVY